MATTLQDKMPLGSVLSLPRSGNIKCMLLYMSNGQCSSGADTAKSFAKFGHGETEGSALADIHRVYNFDYDNVDGMMDGFIKFNKL